MNGLDPVAAALHTNQQQARVQAELAATQRLLYVQMAAPALACGESVELEKLRDLAQRAKLGAMVIFEAQGLMKLEKRENRDVLNGDTP